MSFLYLVRVGLLRSTVLPISAQHHTPKPCTPALVECELSGHVGANSNLAGLDINRTIITEVEISSSGSYVPIRSLGPRGFLSGDTAAGYVYCVDPRPKLVVFLLHSSSAKPAARQITRHAHPSAIRCAHMTNLACHRSAGDNIHMMALTAAPAVSGLFCFL